MNTVAKISFFSCCGAALLNFVFTRNWAAAFWATQAALYILPAAFPRKVESKPILDEEPQCLQGL